MNIPHQIKTIDEFNEITLTEKKSNFIAQVYSVSSENEVKENLSRSKKKYFNASHHCYAFKLANGTLRYSDAGEPAGTAGIRILNAIEHFKLSNQLVIVSRLFGGIKLGVGPLGKAYYSAAIKVLDESTITNKQLYQKVTIKSAFDHTNLIHRILSAEQSVIINSEYLEDLTINCLIRSKDLDSISQKLLLLSKNKIILIPHQEFYYK